MSIPIKTRDFRSAGSSSGYGLVLIDDDTRDALNRLYGAVSQRATSASGGLRAIPTHGSPMIGGGLLGRGTSASAGLTVRKSPDDVPLMLADIKRMTGYSWKAVGDLLGVSRQAVHNWTQGGVVRPENAKQISALHETLKFIDRGSQTENSQLLATVYAGRSFLDMLASRDFVAARSLAGKGAGRPGARWSAVEPVPSGRQDHWTDRIVETSSDDDSVADFLPSKVVRKVKLKVK